MSSRNHNDITKGLGLQKFMYRFCQTVIGPWLYLVCHFHPKPCRVKSGTFLAVANHTQNLDPALMVLGLNRHIRFVANSTLGKGKAGHLFRYFFGFILREKGAKGDVVTRQIEENLKAGVSVGLFPEGNRSWDGVTEFISKRTAKMVKESGAALVTYRFTGGYLLKPRWAATKRHGPMRGELMHEYSPEQLASMTEDEVYKAMCDDLYVDAYMEQALHGDVYRGKRLAEGMQYAAYLCPCCHRFGTIETSGDDIYCSCGLRATYNEYGRINGEKLPFDTLKDWNRFQKEWMSAHSEELCAKTDDPIVSDSHFHVTRISEGVPEVLSEDAVLSIYGDRLEIAFPAEGRDTIVYDLYEITGMGNFLARSVYFNCGSSLRYQLKAHNAVSVLKYYALWRVLTGREYL
ncbi:MAG: 1-acyl-sn-glycerol-3-phosphate acyltransferase [Bacteroidales bacterium]|nr:1-acyl-sn-glycerol-3-phosphate acyltransferase [Bacteroidales bacterium]